MRSTSTWTQQRIADAKGISQQLVGVRTRLHECSPIRKAVLDDVFDEGHAQEVLGVYQTSSELKQWLTTSQAQTDRSRRLRGLCALQVRAEDLYDRDAC